MSLLRPDDVIAHVSQITPEFLARRGLRGWCWTSTTR